MVDWESPTVIAQDGRKLVILALTFTSLDANAISVYHSGVHEVHARVARIVQVCVRVLIIRFTLTLHMVQLGVVRFARFRLRLPPRQEKVPVDNGPYRYSFCFYFK
jgi:hypothetical protein